jgi:hypothetical protein
VLVVSGGAWGATQFTGTTRAPSTTTDHVPLDPALVPRARRSTVRLVLALAVASLALVAAAAPAAADPPAPTDYRSEVVSVEPPVDGLEVRVVGGDAFLEVVAPPGRQVLVPGYRGEPYLRLDPDGSVWQNDASPAVLLNEERMGGVDVPDGDGGEPRWRQVGDGGRAVWHDHRTHWMQEEPPLDLSPGDQILDGVVLLVVDGQEVEVRAISTWEHRPSPLPAVAGALLGALAVAVVWWRRGPLTVAWVVTVTAAAAAAVGAAQVWSVPAATGPSALLWALPATALVAAAASAVLGARDPERWGLVAAVLQALAAVELGLWAWNRRTGLWRAVLPTDAPWPLDRGVTAAAAVVAIAAVAACAAVSWPALARPLGSAGVTLPER